MDLLMTSDTTRIGATVGITRNLGNFESLRYDLTIEDYVRDGEDLHSAVIRVRRKVETELQDAINELESEIAETKAANKRRGG